jgi:prepilin-type N-terminal cleavage/methylation domain-containing protein
MNPVQSIRHGSGFTLLELLVGTVLGAMISMAALSMYQMHLAHWYFQSAATTLQQQSRAAMDHLRSSLTELAPGWASSHGRIFALDSPVAGTGRISIADTPYDQLVMLVESGTDCTGDVLSTHLPGWKHYLIVNQELRCRDSDGQSVAIVDGVDVFQVRYGVDLDGDGIANRYLNAQAAVVYEAAIVSVRIGWVLQSGSALRMPGQGLDLQRPLVGVPLAQLGMSSGNANSHQPLRRAYEMTVVIQ